MPPTTRLGGFFAGQLAVITGGASGIGAGVARALAARGATVVVADLQAEKGEALAAEIGQAAPLAVGMAKRVIDGLADLDRGLQLEGWAQSQLFQTEDFQEALASFMMRRPPQFKGK